MKPIGKEIPRLGVDGMSTTAVDAVSPQRKAVYAGLGWGAIGAILGGLEGGMVAPEFVRKFKSNRAGRNVMQAIKETARGNKLLTFLVTAPATVGAVCGIWGYVSARKALTRSEQSPAAAESEYPQIFNDADAKSEQTKGNDPTPTWQERIERRDSSRSKRSEATAAR